MSDNENDRATGKSPALAAPYGTSPEILDRAVRYVSECYASALGRKLSTEHARRLAQAALIAQSEVWNENMYALAIRADVRPDGMSEMAFLVHELQAGRGVPKGWHYHALVKEAVFGYATAVNVTASLVAGTEFTEAQLDGMKESLKEFHTTLEPGRLEALRGLTFEALRAANAARCPMFLNAKGEPQHSGRDWSPNDWGVATGGELGEAMNLMKKVRRGDMTLEEARPKLAQEFSDVVIYLDMLANACGVNLGESIMTTFNAKSDQLELDLFITETGPVRERPK